MLNLHKQNDTTKTVPVARCINSTWLHIIAMVLMLSDHMWGTVMHGNDWMTCIGRLAYPIFAFMIVEGYFHTHDLKKYFRRLLIGAVISEIPFNLMLGGYWIDPFDQNVLWTLMIGLTCVHLTELMRKRCYERCVQERVPVSERDNQNDISVKRMITVDFPVILAGTLIFFCGAVIGLATFVDYSSYGVLMIGVFYAFRGSKWHQMLGQLLGMILINGILFRGMSIDITLFGHTVEILQQGLAVFALIPIWMYNGKKGFGGKTFQVICYLFYPVHILVLSLIALHI